MKTKALLSYFCSVCRYILTKLICQLICSLHQPNAGQIKKKSKLINEQHFMELSIYTERKIDVLFCFVFFYLDAVKICLELVHMALIGLS